MGLFWAADAGYSERWVSTGKLVLSPKSNIVNLSDRQVTQINDKLVDFVTGLGGSRDRTTTQSFAGLTLISEVEIETMYRSDWLSRKIVDIVPQDMVRVGRRWQAPATTINKIYREERRREVQLWGKLHEALVRARLSGGAGIFIGIRNQNPSLPLDPESVGPGDLAYLNVLSRHRMGFEEIDRDPQSPWYGQPVMWRLSRGDGRFILVHPSRIVTMVGAPIVDDFGHGGYRPSLLTTSVNDGVFGDSILQVVYEALKNAASVQQHVAGLVPDARNDVMHIPNLGAILDNAAETAKLTRRFGYARDIRSMFNTLLLEGNGVTGAGGRGEQWTQRQVSFSELPEIIQQFLKIAAGAADIPVTRLLNDSPSGENSTGESDLRNYYDHIHAKQRLMLDPIMDQIDAVVHRSAGVTPDDSLVYEWASLWSSSPKERAEIFEKKTKGYRQIAGSGKDLPLVDLRPLSEAMVNDLTEESLVPGLEKAVATGARTLEKIVGPDDMVSPEPAPASKPEAGSLPTQDAQPRTLYVSRQLLNTAEFIRWASDQGIRGILPSDQLHVTVLYSRTPVDWLKMGQDMWSGSNGKLSVPPGGPRVVEKLGPTATVLSFSSSVLAWRHREMLEAGASTDYPGDYVAHVTISHESQIIDVSKIEAFQGELRFGPEIFREVDEDWKSKVTKNG